jgi:hypothetical protein
MRPTFKKLEVKHIGDLERLVAENVEGIEPGLKVIDSRLLLGQAAIDLVGLDAKESLVLIALDFTADEGLLLRVMDAYSWCLEYPDTIRRLYPMAQVTSNRPPRILFIVERLTDSFVRRIKQLSFLEIDCLEFRHLEVNGASALYFDLVQRLRRSEAAEAASETEPKAPGTLRSAQPPQAGSAPAPAPVVAVPVVAPAAPIAPVPQAAPIIEPVRPVVEPERPAVELWRAAVAETEVASPAPEPALSLAARIGDLYDEPDVQVVEERAVETETPSLEETVTAEAEQSGLGIGSLEESASLEEPVAPLVDASNNPEWQALLSELGVEVPVRKSAEVEAEAPVIAAEATEAMEEPATVSAAEEAGEQSLLAQAAVAPAPPPEPPPPTPPAWAKPTEKGVQPNSGRTYFFAQAVKGTTPAEPKAAPPSPAPAAAAAPAAVAAAAQAAPAAKPAPASEPAKAAEAPAENRPELDSLNFPKDGLSRQWLEFLNQLSAAK